MTQVILNEEIIDSSIPGDAEQESTGNTPEFENDEMDEDEDDADDENFEEIEEDDLDAEASGNEE